MSTIKLGRAAKLSPLSRYPQTWSALLARIPDGIKATLTAKQIAELVGVMHAQFKSGETAGFKEVA